MRNALYIPILLSAFQAFSLSAFASGWSTNAWPAAEVPRYIVEGGVTQPTQIVWADNVWSAIVERASVIWTNAPGSNLWAAAGLGSSAWLDWESGGYTNNALRHQTWVLQTNKELVAELLLWYVDEDFDPTDFGAWYASQITTNAVTNALQVVTNCSAPAVTANVNQVSRSFTWPSDGSSPWSQIFYSETTAAAGADLPTNFFDYSPYRLQGGVSTGQLAYAVTNLQTALASFTNATTAAGGSTPAGRATNVWYTFDYGWESLKTVIDRLKTTSTVGGLTLTGVYTRDTDYDFSWTNKGETNRTAGATGYEAGEDTETTWSAAKSDAEGNDTDSATTARPYLSSWGYYGYVSVEDRCGYNAGYTQNYGYPTVTNWADSTWTYDVYWYAEIEAATNGVDTAYLAAVDNLASKTGNQSGAKFLDNSIPTWPSDPAGIESYDSDESWFSPGLRLGESEVFIEDSFGLLVWDFTYQD